MIKENELRIGNLIYNGINEVFSVNGQTIANFDLGQSTLGKFKPIPLTEEWLIDFGFVMYIGGLLCKHLNNDDSYLEIDLKYNKGVWLNINQDGLQHSIKLYHIKYVHQLKNLWFALTGQEL